MIDKEALLEKITEEQILEIMEEFGGYPVRTNEKEMWFRTICHSGDSNKLCYFRDSMTFMCYTCCGFMNLFEFIMHVKECDFNEALKYIAKKVGYNTRFGLNIETNSVNKEIKELDRCIALRRKKEKNIVNIPILEEKILDYFENDIFYQGWIDEGIDISTMKEFEISWYELGLYIIIPHRDKDGNLIGIRRRSLQEEDKDNKYMPLILQGRMYNHPLNFNLYGLDKCKSAIQKNKRVCLVEAEKSVLKSWSFYGENSYTVATCGFNISNTQIQHLLEMGVQTVYLAYDKDYDLNDFEDYEESSTEYKEMKRYVDRINSLCHKLNPYFTVYILYDYKGLIGHKDSPFDKSKEIFEQIMDSKILYEEGA